MDLREGAARELVLDARDQREHRGLAVVRRRDRLAGEPAAEAAVERALGARVARRVVEQVVGQRVQHAVGEEAVAERDRAAEAHLQAVPDPHVAQRLAEALDRERRVELPRLPREGERRREEGVAEGEAAVARGPAEPPLAERAQPPGDGVLPRAARALLARNRLRLRRELVEEPARGVLVREVPPPADPRAEVRQRGRGRPPQAGVLVAQRGDVERHGAATGSRGGREGQGCPHARSYAAAARRGSGSAASSAASNDLLCSSR